MSWEQNFRTDGRFQGSDGFRGNFMQENPRMHGHTMSPVQGQFRHPKPYFDSPRLPFQRSGFQNPQNYHFNRPPYQPRPAMSGFHYQQPRNSNSFDRQWKHPKSRSQKFDDKFDIKRYYKESMLEDPWKELIQKRSSEKEKMCSQ